MCITFKSFLWDTKWNSKPNGGLELQLSQQQQHKVQKNAEKTFFVFYIVNG